jgi:hypothetical protein
LGRRPVLLGGGAAKPFGSEVSIELFAECVGPLPLSPPPHLRGFPLGHFGENRSRLFARLGRCQAASSPNYEAASATVDARLRNERLHASGRCAKSKADQPGVLYDAM